MKERETRQKEPIRRKPTSEAGEGKKKEESDEGGEGKKKDEWSSAEDEEDKKGEDHKYDGPFEVVEGVIRETIIQHPGRYMHKKVGFNQVVKAILDYPD